MSKELQKILKYSAVFDPAEEGGYNVSFPSFPGCVTFGHNFEEAKKLGQEVLELWLEELADQEEEILASLSRPIVDDIQISIPSNAKIHYASTHR